MLCRGLALQYAEEKLWRSPYFAPRGLAAVELQLYASCGTAAAAVPCTQPSSWIAPVCTALLPGSRRPDAGVRALTELAYGLNLDAALL